MKLKFFYLFFLLVTLSLYSVENSIIPLMDKYEMIENLPAAKYPAAQFNEIARVLNNKDHKIRFMTYNILRNDHDDKREEENRWGQRLSRVIKLIQDAQPDVMGLQEVYSGQLTSLLPYIGKTYDFYTGLTNNDSEINVILFRKDRFKVIAGKGWHMNRQTRSGSLTMMQLCDNQTGNLITFFDAHLAFSNVEERATQASFIAQVIEEYAQKSTVIFAGDLNMFPQRLDKKFPFLDGEYIHRILTKGSFRDARDVSILGHLGPISTFTNQDNDDPTAFKGVGTPGVMLDHIYVSKDVAVIVHAVQPGTVDGHFPSDHMPVLIDFIVDK